MWNSRKQNEVATKFYRNVLKGFKAQFSFVTAITDTSVRFQEVVIKLLSGLISFHLFTFFTMNERFPVLCLISSKQDIEKIKWSVVYIKFAKCDTLLKFLPIKWDTN